MKRVIGVISVILLIISFSSFIYNSFISPMFRYQTPAESFEKSCPRNSKLIDIIEDENLALLIYLEKDGAFCEEIIIKDNRGWTPMSTNMKFNNIKEIYLNDQFIFLKQIDDRYVVEISILADINENIGVISDSIGSTFITKTYELNSNRKIIYGLLVLDESFPDEYKIFLGDEEIEVF